jgi:hypothetical protein
MTSQKEVSALFMTGYDFPKRIVCSLFDRLRLPKKKYPLSLTGYDFPKRSVRSL